MRNIRRQCGCLIREQCANQTDGAQRDKHTQADGGRGPQSASPEELYQRREDEGQQDSQRDRNQDVLRDVQRRYHNRRHGNSDEGPELGRRRSGHTRRRVDAPEVCSLIFPVLVVAGELLLIGHWVDALQGLGPTVRASQVNAARPNRAKWPRSNMTSGAGSGKGRISNQLVPSMARDRCRAKHSVCYRGCAFLSAVWCDSHQGLSGEGRYG